MAQNQNIENDNQKNIKIEDKKSNIERIEWQAPEFLYYEKNSKWYFCFWIFFALILTIFILFYRSLMAIILFAIFSIVLYFYSRQKPKIINYSIGPTGIKINDILYPYERIESFWILYFPPTVKEIVLKMKKSFMTYLKIQLENENPVVIRNILLKYIPEELYEEGLIDIIARILKF